jgi:hypothetical protein
MLQKTGYLAYRGKGKLIFIHREIVEKDIGRGLLPTEHVHHKNGNKLDNSIENLEIVSASEHRKIHLTSDKAKSMSLLGHKARWGHVSVL